MADDSLIREAKNRSIELLERNSCAHGILAATDEQEGNYHAVWGRDGAICACACFLSGEKSLAEAAVTTLTTLAENQGKNGQIPSYIPVSRSTGEIEEVIYGGLGNVTAIDANLWFLIACQTACDFGYHEFIEDKLIDVYERVLRHLYSIDCDCDGLLEVPVAGDWTDILDRSYHVLYDEVLWFRALRCAGNLCEARGEDEKAQRLFHESEHVRARLNRDFWWENKETIDAVCERYFLTNEIPRERPMPYYQTHLRPFANRWWQRFDAFANVLAALMGVADEERSRQIIERVFENDLASPWPLRVLDPPILPEDDDWTNLDDCKEAPWVYHNAGFWPLAGGFWVTLLARAGRAEQAADALKQLAEALRCGKKKEWEFREYFHGKTHEPMGRCLQSWSAAAFLMAYEAVKEEKFACFQRGMQE